MTTEIAGFSDIIHDIMQDLLKITDKDFRMECYETVKKWIMEKQKALKNSAISPYRESLKKCESSVLFFLNYLLLH